MAKVKCIVVMELHSGILNQAVTFSLDYSGMEESAAFVRELMVANTEPEDHEEMEEMIKRCSGFSSPNGDYDVFVAYT